MPPLKLSLVICLTIATISRAVPVPEGQVDHEIELEDLEDLLAVENQIDKSIIAIAPPPKDFPGERLVSIAPAPKDFPGERLTGGAKKVEDPSIGTYSFSYETENGMKRSETGGISETGGMSQTGSWEYVGPDGRVYKIEFIADENGFRPIGQHLPTPPALPPALQRFEDAKNGKLSRGVASAAVLDIRQGRDNSEFDPDSEVEFLSPMVIEFGPKKRSNTRRRQRRPTPLFF